MRRSPRIVVTAGLSLTYVVLLVAAVAGISPLFLVAAVVAVVTELLLSRRAPRLLPELLNGRLGVRFRVLSLDVLVALLAARTLPDTPSVVALVVVAVVVLAAGRDGAGVFSRRLVWWRAGGPVSWRGLTVPGLPVPRESAPVREPDAVLTVLALVLPVGLAVGPIGGRGTEVALAAWTVLGVVVVFAAVRSVQLRRAGRRSTAQVREAVRAAIELAAPEVVVHHSGRRGTVEQVLLWLPALAALRRRCLIVVREPTHLAALDGCGVPVVWAPRSQDVEQFMVGSIDLALYPSDATNINNHLLRVPGIYDVLIGHGDSDEPESRSPIARMYDEVWVSGPAGRRRYAYPTSGVAAGKIREIGPVRPALPAAGAAPRPTVVYAPTWENAVDAADLSSVLARGERILDALLARQEVRTVLVPAAPTGSRVGAYAGAVRRLSRRLAAAQGDHVVLPPDALPEALATAVLAVVDVSPAVAEAIRHDVPFAVPAVDDLDAARMRDAFPMAAAGAVLVDYPHDVFAALDDALGPDEHAAARLALGRDLDASGDFVRRFRDAVDEAIAAQRRRRAYARPSA